MSDERVVKVTLEAQMAEYIEGMIQASRATKTTAEEVEKLRQKEKAFKQLGPAALVFGGALAAGIGVAVKKAADFNEAMSAVDAATHESADNMALLRQAALDLGADTVFSATEAANGIEEMAKAGVSTADILGGGLKGALDLAAAGGLGVGDAAEIASVALKTFNLDGTQMSHVADLLAAGAGKAMGSVEDLSMALRQGGQVASATGLSIEETTAGLAAFASKGLIGSDAGTSFKTMLQRLNPTSKEASALMDQLGVHAYDASGKFIGLAKYAGVLQSSMKDLTPEARNAAMATLFGSDAVRAANVLYEEGAAGIHDWIAAVNDQGYAADTAARRLNNLKGDMEALSGALDTAFITMGDSATGPLRMLVQGLTGLVDLFNSLPDPAKDVIFWAGLVAAGLALVGGTALLAVPKVAEFKASLDVLNLSMGKLSMIGGLAAGALGVIITVVGVLASAQADAAAKAKAYADTLDETTGKITEATRKMTAENLSKKPGWWFLEGDSVFDQAKKLGVSLELVTDAALGSQDAIAKLNSELDFGKVGSEKWNAVLERTGLNTTQLASAQSDLLRLTGQETSAIEEGKAALAQKAEALTTAKKKTEENQTALKGLSGQSKDTAENIEKLADKIRGFGALEFDTREANRRFEASFRDLKDSIQKNGTELDIHTEKGAANEAALDDFAQASLRAAGAIMHQTGSQEQASAKIQEGRDKLIEMLGQLGITGDAAQAYADKLKLIPSEVNTTAKVLNVETVEQAMARLTRDRYVRIFPEQVSMGYTLKEDPERFNFDGGMYVGGVPAQKFADGGIPSHIVAGRVGGYRVYGEAEMGVPWETYISGRASARDRNIGIWMETGRRLGVSGEPSQTVEQKTLNVTVNSINPVARDPMADAREAAQLAAANVDM